MKIDLTKGKPAVYCIPDEQLYIPEDPSAYYMKPLYCDCFINAFPVPAASESPLAEKVVGFFMSYWTKLTDPVMHFRLNRATIAEGKRLKKVRDEQYSNWIRARSHAILRFTDSCKVPKDHMFSATSAITSFDTFTVGERVFPRREKVYTPKRKYSINKDRYLGPKVTAEQIEVSNGF